MLLFGGSLTGPDAKRNGAPRNKETDAKPLLSTVTMPSPRTDVLHRLTNHELRLLEELERTRATLQAEWRHKIGGAGGDSRVDNATIEQLAQQLGLPHPATAALAAPAPSSPVHKASAAKAAMRAKPLLRTSNQYSSTNGNVSPQKHRPVSNVAPALASRPLRTSFDMLPVLTTSAETPFEVGLDSASPSAQSQHMLPIFRLPTFHVTATASALAVREAEAVDDARERQQASDALGLSVHEIAQLEAKLNGTHKHNSDSDSDSDRRLPGLRPQQQQQETVPAPRNALRRTTRRKAQRAANTGSSTTTTHATPAQQRERLRSELAAALGSVQRFTRCVKDDLVLAQRICPATDLRTSLYFQRWGRDKVAAIFRRLVFNLQGLAFAQWRRVVAHEQQTEKMQAYVLYKGATKLDAFVRNWTQRRLRFAWTKWHGDLQALQAIERRALEVEASRVLQRAWRGYSGRQFAQLVKTQRRVTQRTHAATIIQRQFRRSVARTFVRLQQRFRQQQRAAISIQALVRGFLARQRVRLQRHRQREHSAARRIQALQRGRLARRAVAVQRQRYRITQAAVRVQRRYRNRLGHVAFIRRQLARFEYAAATTIQRIARGRIARRLVSNKRAAAAVRLVLQNKAALAIQRVYRGHRSRLVTELKLLALHERNKWRAKAATRIQTTMRCWLARQVVARRRVVVVALLVETARVFVECWSDDAMAYFYYNEVTGESLWAPPVSGYTKVDGSLVLRTGKCILDPLGDDADALAALVRDRKALPTTSHTHDAAAVGSVADDANDDDDRLCVECEDDDARRRCLQCEDVFCDACFERLHRSSSKRAAHSWVAIGTMRCIECEKMKATRWCSVCRDPYCLGCFSIIHARGNKATHAWTDMATFQRTAKSQQQQMPADESAQTYDEFMQSTEYAYVTALAADESTLATSSVVGGGDGEEWMTLVDAASGQLYYYNNRTGESRWA